MLERRAVRAPVRKPASLPKAMAVIMIIAVTGLKCGTSMKISRDNTLNTVIQAMTSNSLSLCLPFSKLRKTGIKDKAAIPAATRTYCLLLKRAVPTMISAGMRRK